MTQENELYDSTENKKKGIRYLMKFIEIKTIIIGSIWVLVFFLIFYVHGNLNRISNETNESETYKNEPLWDDLSDETQDELKLEQAISYIKLYYYYDDVSMQEMLETAWSYAGEWDSYYWENDLGETKIIVEYSLNDDNCIQFQLDLDYLEQQNLGEIYAMLDGEQMTYEEMFSNLYEMRLVENQSLESVKNGFMSEEDVSYLNYIQEYQYNGVSIKELMDNLFEVNGQWLSYELEDTNEIIHVVEYSIDEKNGVIFELDADSITNNEFGTIYQIRNGIKTEKPGMLETLYTVYDVE